MSDDTQNLEEEHFTLVGRDMVPATEPEKEETTEEKQRRILKWLDPTDYDLPGNEYRKHLNAYVPGTGEWADQYPAFRSWRSADSKEQVVDEDTDSGVHVPPPGAHGVSLLHVRGVAGSGKSVFAASTIKQLQDAGHAVLFFFFRQIVDKNHAAKYLLRDFTAQMMLQSEGESITDVLHEFSSYAPVEDMTDVLWSMVLRSTTEGQVGKRVFVVVDALDELDDADFEDTMDKLLELGSANPEIVKVMFTGRPLPKMEDAVQGKGVSQLKLDPVLLTWDVARYVETRMAKLEQPLSSQVRMAICERANGLFLHARLMTDNLAESLQDGRITEQTLPDSLQRLPRSLSDVYEELLKEHSRRSGVSTNHQAKILTCVIHSRNPMRLIELGSLMAHLLKVDLRQGKDLVRASCGRLLELLPDETVSIIHHSFTEFLHQGSRKDAPGAFPVLDDALAHDMLAATCLEYLDTCPNFDVTLEVEVDVATTEVERARRREASEKLRLECPLALYAAANCAFHLEKSGNSPSGLGIAAVDAHLAVGHAAFENWALVNWTSSSLGVSLNPLHLLLGIPRNGPLPFYVVKHLLDAQPALVDATDPHKRTPLIMATQIGREDVVALLLSKGAKTDAASESGLTALHWAATYGDVKVAETLLRAGVDPLIRAVHLYQGQYTKPNEDTALFMGMESTNRDMSTLFLPYLPAEEAGAFFIAANNAHVLEAVLNTGVIDINADCPQGEFDREAPEPKLWKVIAAGKMDMIKVLLKHGADPKARQPGRRTALHALVDTTDKAWLDDEDDDAYEVVRLLVEAGADIDAKVDQGDEYHAAGYTALHYSVSRPQIYGSDEMVLSGALLKAGANVHATTATGDTPLHIANPQEPRLPKLLVDHGADINARNAAGQTPLMQAISRLAPHKRRFAFDVPDPDKVAAFIQALLELGADAGAVDRSGNNLFHFIMESISVLGQAVYIPLIERLTKVADVNHKNDDGQTPIFWYKRGSLGAESHKDMDEVLKMLMASGMRLDGSDKDGMSLLHHLLQHQQHASLQATDAERLIRLGADPSSTGPDGKSLLHRAIRLDKDLELLQYLSGISSVAEAIDGDGNNLIHDIVAHSKASYSLEPLIGWAISAGVNPLALNGKGQSALHLALPLTASLVVKDPRFGQLDANARDVDGRTPLHNLAAWSEELVDILVKRGADPCARDSSGFTPLHCAAKAGACNVVDYLVKQPTSVHHVNSLAAGFSPLHYACEAASAVSVAVLLRAGAHPDLVSDTGYTPLHMLSRAVPQSALMDCMGMSIRTPDAVQALHRAGARLDATVVSSDDTALDLAARAKRWEVVRELMACGAAVKAHHNESRQFQLATDKQLALDAAREMKAALDVELAALPEQDRKKRLYRNRPYLTRWAAAEEAPPPENVVCWILGPETLLHLPKGLHDIPQTWLDLVNSALDENDFDTVKEYHDQGHLLHETQGDLLLLLLVRRTNFALLRYFAQHQPSQRASSSSSSSKAPPVVFSTALLTAVCGKKTPAMDILEWLVDDVGLDVRDKPEVLQADWPVQVLATGEAFWHLQALQYVLSKGADVEKRTRDGLTPLLASFDEHRRIGPWNVEAAAILTQHGANVNATIGEAVGEEDARDTDGRAGLTALHLAKGAKAIRFLMSAGADAKQAAGALVASVRAWMDVETTNALLDAGLDPNETPPIELTEPEMMTANETDHQELLGRAYVMRENRFALHYAGIRAKGWHIHQSLYERQLAMVKLLLSRGADPMIKYSDGSFVLQRLIQGRGMAVPCIEAADTSKLNERGTKGRTALIEACIPGDQGVPKVWYEVNDHGRTPPPPPTVMADAITALVSACADVCLTDDQGRTALHWMCTQKTPFDDEAKQAFQALLDKGGPFLVHAVDNQGRLPLHLALASFACLPSMDFAIRALMAAGAKVETPDPETGDSALHMLARRMGGWEKDAVEQARALFSEIAKSVNIHSANKAGETVAAAAVTAEVGWSGNYTDSEETAMMLGETVAIITGELGAKVDYIDAKGKNLLHVIIERELPSDRYDAEYEGNVMGMSVLFMLMMELGVDPRKEDDALRTPIDVASARELHEVLMLFNDMDNMSEQGQDDDDDRQDEVGEEEDKHE